MEHCVFMFRIAVEPPQGDQDARAGSDLRSKSPSEGPRFCLNVAVPEPPVKENTFKHVPFTPLGISLNPCISVSRMENLAISDQQMSYNASVWMCLDIVDILEALIKLHV